MELKRSGLVLAASLAMSVGPAATGQTIVWTGAVSNRWGDPLNWEPQRRPGAEDDVLIGPGGFVFDIVAPPVNSLDLARELNMFGSELRVRERVYLRDGWVRLTTFSMLFPSSALIFYGPDARIDGVGRITIGEGEYEESPGVFAEQRLTIGPDITIRFGAGPARLRGTPLYMYGTVIVGPASQVQPSVEGILGNLNPVTHELVGGTWILEDQARLDLRQAIRGIGRATVVQLGVDARFDGLHVLNRVDGTLVLDAGAGLTLGVASSDTLTNDGSIDLGAGSMLRTDGSFAQQTSGVLSVHVGPSAVGHLHAGAELCVSGALRLQFVPGHVPAGNEVLVIMSGANVSGEFESLEVSPAPPAGPAHVVYRSTSVSVALCYADCDGTSTLTIFDYLCFSDRFAAEDAYACDCDTSTGAGVCDIFDFVCFGNRFAAGCD